MAKKKQAPPTKKKSSKFAAPFAKKPVSTPIHQAMNITPSSTNKRGC